MKASICVFIAALAAGASAKLHYTGFCVDQDGYAYVYNAAATKAACDSYLHRNTGNKQWDQCPDCTKVDDRDSNGNVALTYCHSGQQHIGGDELYYYCRMHGAADSLAW